VRAIGQVTLDDLLGESERPALPAKPTLVKQLRESHHDLAMKVAQGYNNIECSALTGYSPTTISQLRADPAFQELVKHYKDKTERQYVDLQERMLGLAGDTIETLAEKVRTEDLTVNQLTEIAKLTLDRSGHGPQSKSTNLNINATVPTDMLSRIKAVTMQRGEVRRLGTTTQPSVIPPAIEGKVVAQDQGHPDTGSEPSLALGEAGPHPGVPQVARVEGPGQSLRAQGAKMAKG
jgi:hypothetical protein